MDRSPYIPKDAGKSNIAAYNEIISSGKMCSDPGA
jgi:hypothetical protein